MPRRTLLLVTLGLTCLAAAEERVMLPVTADEGISSVRGKTRFSNGGAPSTAIRQNQNWSGFENKTLLMAFDTRPIAGLSVSRATLHLTLAKGDLYGVGLCTVLAPWQEGPARNWEAAPGAPCWEFAAAPAPGAAPTAENYWAGPGSMIFSVAWAHPHLRYSHAAPADLKREKTADGRFTRLLIPVRPELVEAVAIGASYGLILTDDKGQVTEAYSLLGTGKPYRYNEAEDVYAFTRDIQVASLRPVLEVVGERKDKTPPAAPARLEVAAVQPSTGQVTVRFVAPGDDGAAGTALAYEVTAAGPAGKEIPLPRWSLPLPAPGGKQQEMPVFTLPPGEYRLSIRAVDEAGNRGPAATVSITVPPKPDATLAATPAAPRPPAVAQLPADPDGRLTVYACPDVVKVDPVSGDAQTGGRGYRPAGLALGNPVWDPAAGTVKLQAAANEVVAFQLICLKRDAELGNVRVAVSDLAGPDGKRIDAARNVESFRVWYVNVNSGQGPGEWHGDACLPLKAPFAENFSIPAADNKIPGQRLAAAWVDVYVPRGSAAGEYTGQVSISADGLDKPVTVKLKVAVLPIALPDRPTWTVDLNRYGPMTAYAGVKAEQAAEAERLYHRLAHRHRCTIEMLPYNQSGVARADFVPALGGEGAKTAITDWSKYDERFGPLLDGSAFTAKAGYVGPGEGVPLSHIYLPFNENWPIPINKATYRDWADLPDRLAYAEWAKTSRPPEAAFTREYQDGFAGVVRQWFEHFQEKGWTGTALHFYFNNKYYAKCGMFSERGGGGSSFWLLDEPIDYDDYDANRFFLALARRGVAGAKAPLVRAEFRTDVSAPTMTRGLWDGVCTLWNSSGMYWFGPTSQLRGRWLAEDYWCYGGGTPGAQSAPAGMAARLLWSWSMGTSGDMPYWNFGSSSWTRPDDLNVIYSGKNYAGGKDSYPGGLPGVRLKLLRRCQQDIEYLHLLAGRAGWDRPRATAALAAHADDPAAAWLTFTNLTAEKWIQLRHAVAATIMGSKE